MVLQTSPSIVSRYRFRTSPMMSAAAVAKVCGLSADPLVMQPRWQKWADRTIKISVKTENSGLRRFEVPYRANDTRSSVVQVN